MTTATSVEVTIRYSAGHSVTTMWVPTSYFCPNCGEERVWVEDDKGDYYVGPQHICVGCGAEFSLPDGTGDRADDQVLAQLRAVAE